MEQKVKSRKSVEGTMRGEQEGSKPVRDTYEQDNTEPNQDKTN